MVIQRTKITVKKSKEEVQKLRNRDYGEHMTKLWLSAYGPSPDGRPHITSFDMVKYLIERNAEKEKQTLIFELSKVIDSKFDLLNGKLSDLMTENRNLSADYRKSKRFLLSRFGEEGSLNTNPMQKAFVECVEAVKRDIEKRKAKQGTKTLFDKTSDCCVLSPVLSKEVVLPKYLTLEQFHDQDKIKVMHEVFQNQLFMNSLY